MSDNVLLLNQFFSDNTFSKFFEQTPSAPFATDGLVETHRKNIQAFSESYKMAFETFQTLIEKQRASFSGTLSEQARLATDLLNAGTPEDKLSKQTDAIKALYEKASKDAIEMSQMLHLVHMETAKMLQKRVSATFTEVKSSIEKQTRAKKTA